MTNDGYIDKNDCHINRNQLAQDLKELIKKSEEYTEKISSIKIEQLEKSLKESIKILQDSSIDQKTALKIVEEILDKTLDEKIDNELEERIEFLLNSLKNSKQIEDIVRNVNVPVTATIKFFYTFIVPSIAVLLSAAVSYGVFTTRLQTLEQSHNQYKSAVEIRVSGLERRIIELERKSHAIDITFLEINQKVEPINNIKEEVNTLKIQQSSLNNNLSTLLRDLRKIFNWCDKNENCR